MDLKLKKIFKRASLMLLAIIASNMTFAAQHGFYGDLGLGLGFGPSNTVVKSELFSNSGGTLSANTSDVYTLQTRGVTTGYINVGYNFTPYFGAEADVTYWGKQDLSSFANNVTTETGQWSGKLQSYSYGLNGVGYLPLAETKINLFAKLGIAIIHSELNVNDPKGSVFFNPGSYTTTSNAPGLLYGAGAEYQFNKNISGQLEWKGINRFNDSRISNISYNLIAIGLRYTFC
ncbi:MAG: porin family protein [Gammaproteobacteria bacterium]|nr:porin family protein [Gammaproteobacteria bacterium]